MTEHSMDACNPIAPLLNTHPAAESLSVLGPTVRILAEYGAGDDDLCLIHGTMCPGVFVPLHSHADGENWFVMRGAVRVFRDGDGWAEVGADASFRIVDGILHALHNCGAAPVEMLLVTTVRMARFFRAIGTPVSGACLDQPSPEALSRLIEAAHRFGYCLGNRTDNEAVGLPMA